jgi:hypothetical protein
VAKIFAAKEIDLSLWSEREQDISLEERMAYEAYVEQQERRLAEAGALYP